MFIEIMAGVIFSGGYMRGMLYGNLLNISKEKSISKAMDACKLSSKL